MGSSFITPLPHGQLFEPNVEFPDHELVRRVLSLFWQDCCNPSHFSRAPAPVIELGAADPGSGECRPTRAWWLLEDGILEEGEGPNSERLHPYRAGNSALRLWPRYEFRISTNPFEVWMNFEWDALANQSYRIRLSGGPVDLVRVVARELCQ